MRSWFGDRPPVAERADPLQADHHLDAPSNHPRIHRVVVGVQADVVVPRHPQYATRTCPNPTGSVMGGNQKSCWPISPGRYTVRLAGSGGRYTGRGPATFPLRVRIEYGQPIRCAITVPGSG